MDSSGELEKGVVFKEFLLFFSIFKSHIFWGRMQRFYLPFHFHRNFSVFRIIAVYVNGYSRLTYFFPFFIFYFCKIRKRISFSSANKTH